MLDKNKMSQTLLSQLGAKPIAAERLNILDSWEVDFITFKDRPFEGVNSIFTNGVSEYEGCRKNIEFVFTYSVSSGDMVAFLATYLQLYFISNCNKISVGDAFCANNKIISGYDFTGVYTTKPCYFPDDVFDGLGGVSFFWVLPIYQNEYNYILEYGSDAFESYIEKHDPDMTNFNREPLF